MTLDLLKHLPTPLKNAVATVLLVTGIQQAIAQSIDMKVDIVKTSPTTFVVTSQVIDDNTGNVYPFDPLAANGRGVYDTNFNNRPTWTESNSPDLKTKTWTITVPAGVVSDLLLNFNSVNGTGLSGGITDDVRRTGRLHANQDMIGSYSAGKRSIEPNGNYTGFPNSRGDNQPEGNLGGPQETVTATSITGQTVSCTQGKVVISQTTKGNTFDYPATIQLLNGTTPVGASYTATANNFASPTLAEGTQVSGYKVTDANGRIQIVTFASIQTVTGSPDLVTTAPAPTGTLNFCEGGSTTLTANPTNVSNPIYEWYINGVKQNSLTTATVTINQPGTIFYKVKNTNSGSGTNCYNTTDQYTSPSISVTKNPSNPNVASDLSASATAVCEGTSVQLTELITNANGANYGNKVVTYILPNGTTQMSQINSFPQTVVPVGIGKHKYVANETVTNANGCYTVNLKSDTVTIDVLDKPEVTISRGQNDTLTADVVGTGPFTYQWYKNNIAIPGATNKTYAARSTGTGSYTVEVTTPTTPPCTDLSAATNVVVTGILENISDKMNIYPNPSNDGNFHFESDIPVDEFRIFDMQGQELIHQKTSNKKEFQIQLTNASKGMYLMRIVSGDDTGTIKLIVQ